MTTVPFLDLGRSASELRTEIDAALSRVVGSGRFVLGCEVRDFEAAWAVKCGARHCVGVASGLDALHLALRSMAVTKGCEVIVPSNTYIATWLAVTQTGATLVPVEPDPATYNLDPALLEAAVTPRTRVVLPVHLYGQPADMDALNEVARRHGVLVLEDAAQAQGAHYKGRPVGSLADGAAWSFYPSKNLGALGDAGAVTTDSDELAAQVRILGNYGSSDKYVNQVLGYNSRLDEVQAAVLQVKLEVLESWNERRRSVARRYLEALKGTELVLPAVASWAKPVWHLFVIRSARRDQLREHLAARGVETSIHYPTPPHLQPAYAHLRLSAGSLPTSEMIHRDVLSLPMGPHLTDSQVERVIESVLSFPA